MRAVEVWRVLDTDQDVQASPKISVDHLRRARSSRIGGAFSTAVHSTGAWPAKPGLVDVANDKSLPCELKSHVCIWKRRQSCLMGLEQGRSAPPALPVLVEGVGQIAGGQVAGRARLPGLPGAYCLYTGRRTTAADQAAGSER